jgi:hypothetical protein
VSKKHFKALAEALRAEKPQENWDPNKRIQWSLDVRAVADVCQRMNPNFDRDRFNTACGWGPI